MAIPYGRRKFRHADVGILIPCNIIYGYLNVFSIVSLESVSLQGGKKKAVILPSYIMEDLTLISKDDPGVVPYYFHLLTKIQLV